MFHIMVVEDNLNTRRLMQKVLSQNGYEPILACDGVEALEVLDKKHVDLIVLDIMMPRMDGYEFTQALRDSGYRKLAIAGGVAANSWIRGEFERQCAAMGAALYAIHIGSAALVGLLHRRRGGSSAGALPAAIRMRPSQALIDAVQSAAGAMVQVCAFVVFFLTALRLLTGLTGWSHPALLGFFELTNGILRLPPTRAGFVWAAALLGWGGLSVHCQTAAVLRGAGLSLRPYLRGKALQAALSAATAAFTAQWIL